MHSGKTSFLTKRHHPRCKSPRKRRLVSHSQPEEQPGLTPRPDWPDVPACLPPAGPPLPQSAGRRLSPGKAKPTTRPRITALPAQARPPALQPAWHRALPASPPRHTASPGQGGLILSSESPGLILNCPPRRQVAVTAVMTPTRAGPEARLRRPLWSFARRVTDQPRGRETSGFRAPRSSRAGGQ